MDRSNQETQQASARMWVVVGAVLAVVAAVLAATAWDDVRRWGEAAVPTPRPSATAEPAAATRAATREDFVLRVLRDWDGRRSGAWARGDTAALRRLYVAGSAAGARDVAMLRRWTARGLTVRGMRMQVLGLDVRHLARARLVVDVTDRLVGAEAVAHGRRVVLPRDAPTQRRLVLRREHGRWLVASVVPR